MQPSRPMHAESREEAESEVAEVEARSNSITSYNNSSGGNRIITDNHLVEEEEEAEDMKEVRLELLVGLPEGTNPRCAMVGVPPGISSGTARTSEVRARDSESFVS